ncbi:MAG: 3'-5' exonuclease [Acidimicrobiales bacterium]|jgi:DNA polymerase-3 subunit epsilon|nr:3'-5' exonuclease [Acidimicrobiales bacterium]MDP6298483.1 3'-5' exonuclease [Acidimicrobiales bacterium]HJM28180.1 3'-5' exonuclease [Acidimicrobiales bacterium]HJM97162.1 3'-5' exonuclease [Acidimicrobiales bacterium]
MRHNPSAFNETRFACLDFETTGFSSRTNRVVEVAVVIVENGIIGESWTTLINPGNDHELGASHVHGIKREWLSDAPSFSEIAGDMYKQLDQSVIVAHNADFDLRFLHAEMDRSGYLPNGLHFPNWDSREAAAYAPKATLSRKLSDVATAFDIDLSNAHQALDDTYAVAEIVAALTPVVGEELMFNNLFQSPGEPDPSGMFALRPA